MARVRSRLAVAFGAAMMMTVAAACGARSGFLGEEVDSGSPGAAGDQSVGSNTGADALTEPESDARIADVSLNGADAISNEASVDARTDANDARANDGSADASDGRYAIDASADAGDGRTEASDASHAIDAKDGGAVDADAGARDGSRDALGEPCAVTQVYVDAVHGGDSSDGSAATPYKTITKAIMIAAGDTCIATIFVSPGTYDIVNGEVFPLPIPPNVSLIGDEANKGLPDGGAVFILGYGGIQPIQSATIYPSSGATIAGFKITAPFASPNTGSGHRPEVLLNGPTGVTVRNNTIVGSNSELMDGTVGIWESGSSDNVIVGNVVKGNAIGLYNGAGASSRFESNVVTGNLLGVEADGLGADLGGGAFASVGLNTFSCNEQNLWTTASGQPAANNYWDHVPPTVIHGEGHADIFTPAFWVLTPPTTTGAMLATPNCP